ncbi:hypothetical protein PoB_000015400 [Plakobranchus ocellatus]|uniref:Uncharacterized protein n=1 Tax=Plakobranchus ocellatus TaxID=259542 RepID=A0AAV3XQ61_9GAST|nr:hypothetical protein PoB_000015400 [Plakobranchus ocellatus]
MIKTRYSYQEKLKGDLALGRSRTQVPRASRVRHIFQEPGPVQLSKKPWRPSRAQPRSRRKESWSGPVRSSRYRTGTVIQNTLAWISRSEGPALKCRE